MRQTELKDYEERYSILMSDKKLNSIQKTKALSKIMTDMEMRFNVPMIRNHKWEEENPEVIALYREISFSRDI